MALGRLFRGKLLDALRKLHADGQLDLTGPLSSLANPRRFKKLLRHLYSIDWVVYATPQGGPIRSHLRWRI